MFFKIYFRKRWQYVFKIIRIQDWIIEENNVTQLRATEYKAIFKLKLMSCAVLSGWH